MTITQLLARDARRPVTKTVGDLMGAPDESAEHELSLMLEQCEKAAKEALKTVLDAKAKLTANLSPQGRAALQIMGRDADQELSRLSVLRHEIAKRLQVERARAGRNELSKSLPTAVRALEKARADAEAERRTASPERRRELVREITRAEIVVEACSR
jgi:hypothetical protein